MNQDNLEELENYIEVNEDITVELTDWVYDNIINRTIVELEKDSAYDLIDFLLEGKRENAGFLSFLHLEDHDYKDLIRYIRRAFNKSNVRVTPTMFKAKNHKILMSEYKYLINILFSDPRFLENPL